MAWTFSMTITVKKLRKKLSKNQSFSVHFSQTTISPLKKLWGFNLIFENGWRYLRWNVYGLLYLLNIRWSHELWACSLVCETNKIYLKILFGFILFRYLKGRYIKKYWVSDFQPRSSRTSKILILEKSVWWLVSNHLKTS